jgi:hydroxypyruvate isomerase
MQIMEGDILHTIQEHHVILVITTAGVPGRLRN